MSTIKLEITVDQSNVQILKQLADIIAAQSGLNLVRPESAKEEAKEEAPKAAPAKKAAPKAVKKPETIKEEAAVEEEEENDDLLGEEDEKEVTQEDLKTMLAQKVSANRDAIVKKLKSFGATKISDLDEEHYNDFHAFMTKLK